MTHHCHIACNTTKVLTSIPFRSTHFPNLLRDRRRTYMLGIVAPDTHSFMLGMERQHAVGIWRPNEFVPRSVDIDLTFRVDPRCNAESQTRCEQWKGDSDGERMAWHTETTLRPPELQTYKGNTVHLIQELPTSTRTLCHTTPSNPAHLLSPPSRSLRRSPLNTLFLPLRLRRNYHLPPNNLQNLLPQITTSL